MFSWLRPRKEIDYESILEKLDAEIRQCEFDISSIATAKRRIANAWIFYSSSAYIIAFATHVLYFKSKIAPKDWRITALKIAGLLLGPFFIYGIRVLIFHWFDRQHQSKVELLAQLRGKQQLNVEELKKKTSYYLTKGLIERYETPPKDRKGFSAGNINLHQGKDQVGSNTPSKVNLKSTLNQPRKIDIASSSSEEKVGKGEISKTKNGSKSDTSASGNVGKSPSKKNKKNNAEQPERTWIDKVLDAIIGENDGPESKFALICEKCFNHNGLVLPAEYSNIKFKCLKCEHLNMKGSSMRSPSTNQIFENVKKEDDKDYAVSPKIVESEEGASSCAELAINPATELLNIFKKYEDSDKSDPYKDTLNLSGISIPLKSCTALAAALSNNKFFTKIIVSDSFLGDDGCIKLAHALKSNETVTYLDLRGNSIRSEGAVALANLLKVNSKLKHLFLEWNCLGIWDSGIKSIAESLSINESLETLDLRNNKIGPQSAQNLALCLKHNNSLKKLDLRWNNCGLLGGRAFVDLLQWNQVLIEVDCIGNEMPDEIHRSITAALDRNRTKLQQSVHSKAHSEAMASTIQSLTTSHQEALLILQDKYSTESKHAESLHGQLSIASSEIQAMQDVYKNSQTKVEMLEQECKRLEELIIKERTEMHKQLNDRQKDLNIERESRSKTDEKYQKQLSELTEKVLHLDSKFRQAVTEIDVLSKDKEALKEDLFQAKEKERKLISLWEEKIERMHISHQNKIGELSDLKDREYADKIKRLEEKVRNLENDFTRSQEEITIQKSKSLLEKRQFLERESEIETQIRKQEALHYSELEMKYKHSLSQIESYQDEMSRNQKRFSQQRNDFEAEIKKLSDDRMIFQKEMTELQSQGMKHAMELKILKSKLEEAKTIEIELNNKQLENLKLIDQCTKNTEELDKMRFVISQRDTSVLRLRDELKKRDIELETRDEETAQQMRELQMSINNLLSSRTKTQIRTSAV